ncbi:MAG: cytochrome c biogenesis protein CcsA [Acidobacteria bacterium]|nr:cytochrome c biogenesis protein CcsA [Acidobacteriota bacterium]
MTKLNQIELALAGAMLAVAPWIIDAAPYEATMGLVQKIFYFHMPAAWLFLLAAIIAGTASAMFLFGKKRDMDGWALAAAELAVVFGIITLVTGPLWARKAWGIWWVWDARLTSSLILWMIFVAYLLLRRYGGPGADKLGAGMALFGLANVPFIFVSVNVWRTLHPQTSVVPTLPVQMGGPLWFCITAFFLLFLALLGMRARLERQRVRIEDLYLAEDEA